MHQTGSALNAFHKGIPIFWKKFAPQNKYLSFDDTALL
jgi:hypothetical protein